MISSFILVMYMYNIEAMVSSIIHFMYNFVTMLYCIVCRSILTIK